MKGLIFNSPVFSNFRWVEGHSVAKKSRRQCTGPELMNDTVDNMVDDEFHRALREKDYMHINFPFKKLRVRSNREKIKQKE